MVVDRAPREEEPLRDLGVPQTVGDEPEDVQLAGVSSAASPASGDAGRGRCRARRARAAARAAG